MMHNMEQSSQRIKEAEEFFSRCLECPNRELCPDNQLVKEMHDKKLNQESGQWYYI